MAFKRGGDAATEAANAQRGGGWRKTHFFNLKDGETAFLRYITGWDEIIYVNQHASVKTKNKPAGFEGNWPEQMSVICRYDSCWEGKFKDCYPCDHVDDDRLKNQWGRGPKATVRNWAIAILREEVIGTKEMVEAGQITEDQVGVRIGFKDMTREVEVPKKDSKGNIVEKDGKPETETVIEPAFVVVNMASNNYFDGLGAMNSAYKTINDRDYLVRCTGEGKNKAFTHAPMAETPNLKPGTDRWKTKYLDPIKEIGDSLDLEKILTDRCSDEFIARFIDPDKTDPQAAKGGGGKSSAPDVPISDGDEPDADALAKMRERVRAQGGSTAPSSALVDVD